MPLFPRQHPLVGRLAAGPIGLGGIPPATALPELVSLAGYVDGTITHPSTQTTWLLVYCEWRMTTWLLIEGTGIVYLDSVPEDGDPLYARDAIWVTRDTAVGRGSGPQSAEARFLTGFFTRAGDLDPAATDEPSSAATGPFCPTSPWGNCGRKSR